MASPEKIEAIAAARRLVRETDRAALATAMRNDNGWPYPSFVLICCDEAGAPLMFISGLAEHTRNLLADPRAGLLFRSDDGSDDPLAKVRLTLLGRITPADAPDLRDRFFAKHPSAQKLAALGDFALHRMTIERAHLIAGFGRARWLSGVEFGGAA